MEKDLIKLINETTNPLELKTILSTYHPYDIAKVFSLLEDDDKEKIISLYSDIEFAEILSYAEDAFASDILEDLPETKAAAIINEMEPDDASDVLEEMEEDAAEKLTALLDEDLQDDIEELSNYDLDTAGALMNTNFIKIKSKTSVKEAMKILTKEAPTAETINTIFIVDDNDELKGVMDLKDLIIARMPKTVDDVMMENFIYVDVLDDHDSIVKKVSDYDVKALPVLDNNIIKGIITMDDAFDALTEEAEEDYAKLAGLTEDEEVKETIFGSIKKRIPWLAVLLVLDIFIAMVISIFDEEISTYPILAFFQASVLGLSGNCGTQSLAVSVRRISDGDLDSNKGVRRHILKELLQGLGTGLILALTSFILVFVMLSIKKDELITPVQMGLILAISVFVSVVLANFIGSLLPVIFYKLNIDPAVASGPFITTINDVVSVLTYFGIAMLMFKLLFGLVI